VIALRFAIGTALLLIGWIIARAVGRTRSLNPFGIVLDLAVPVACFGFIASGTGKPMFAGLLIGACETAYAVADGLKR
jgi:hypothetical protein